MWPSYPNDLFFHDAVSCDATPDEFPLGSIPVATKQGDSIYLNILFNSGRPSASASFIAMSFARLVSRDYTFEIIFTPRQFFPSIGYILEGYSYLCMSAYSVTHSLWHMARCSNFLGLLANSSEPLILRQNPVGLYVAPVKGETLPQLELTVYVLGMHMARFVSHTL